MRNTVKIKLFVAFLKCDAIASTIFNDFCKIQKQLFFPRFSHFHTSHFVSIFEQNVCSFRQFAHESISHFFSLYLKRLVSVHVCVWVTTIAWMRIMHESNKKQIKIRNKWCRWRLIHILVIFNTRIDPFVLLLPALFACNWASTMALMIPFFVVHGSLLFRQCMARFGCSAVTPSSSLAYRYVFSCSRTSIGTASHVSQFINKFRSLRFSVIKTRHVHSGEMQYGKWRKKINTQI